MIVSFLLFGGSGINVRSIQTWMGSLCNGTLCLCKHSYLHLFKVRQGSRLVYQKEPIMLIVFWLRRFMHYPVSHVHTLHPQPRLTDSGRQLSIHESWIHREVCLIVSSTLAPQKHLPCHASGSSWNLNVFSALSDWLQQRLMQPDAARQKSAAGPHVSYSEDSPEHPLEWMLRRIFKLPLDFQVALDFTAL